MKELIIFTDASHIPQHNVAAGAWYINDGNETIIGAKVCPKEISNISLAETWTVAQALYSASRIWKLKDFDKITIRTDSLAAINTLHGHTQRHGLQKRLRDAFVKTCGGATVEVSHVLAHKSCTTSLYSYENDVVDSLCRSTARRHINQSNKK